MKNMYWHRKFLSRYIIAFLSVFMLISLYLVEGNLVVENKDYNQKIQAAEITNQAFKITQQDFISKGYTCSKAGDVSCTGLVGESMTEITTDSGDLNAKRSSVNPNMASLFVHWLLKLDLKEGDTVAIQETGSYPALDIAMLSAFKTLKLKPIIILSVGASQFGANRPDFTWPDIYANLVKKGVFDFDVKAVSLGGARDNAHGMTPEAILKMNDAIKRNGFEVLNVPYKNPTETSVKERMSIYEKAANGQPIKAYINVGGSMASIGLKEAHEKKTDTSKKDSKKDEKFIKLKSFPSGIVDSLPKEYKNVISVAVEFLKKDVPVVNIRDINTSIIKEYGLTYNPDHIIAPGEGAVFAQKKYNTTLASILLIIDILLICSVAILSRKYLISYKSK